MPEGCKGLKLSHSTLSSLFWAADPHSTQDDLLSAANQKQINKGSKEGRPPGLCQGGVRRYCLGSLEVHGHKIVNNLSSRKNKRVRKTGRK